MFRIRGHFLLIFERHELRAGEVRKSPISILATNRRLQGDQQGERCEFCSEDQPFQRPSQPEARAPAEKYLAHRPDSLSQDRAQNLSREVMVGRHDLFVRTETAEVFPEIGFGPSGIPSADVDR